MGWSSGAFPPWENECLCLEQFLFFLMHGEHLHRGPRLVKNTENGKVVYERKEAYALMFVRAYSGTPTAAALLPPFSL